MFQNTQNFDVFGQKWYESIPLKKKHFELCGYFLWIKNVKTMWFAPSDILFGCIVHVLLANLGLDPERVQPTQMSVLQLWQEISLVLEFSQTNFFYRLKEKSIQNLGKMWSVFHFEFRFFFSNLKILGFCVF